MEWVELPQSLVKFVLFLKVRLLDVDIDYFFAQVLVDEAKVDYGPTCGNMLSAVGPFAIEQGLIEAKEAYHKNCN